jgi:uncharacterized membrane protein YdjX (TVP38/TMEM64 family)
MEEMLDSSARDFLMPVVLIVLALAAPILPFLILGEGFEQQLEQYLDNTLPPGRVATLTIGLLAVDVLLPVPSSVVSTFAAARLGFLWGLAASWTGMTLGAMGGFGLARTCGRWAVKQLSKSGQLDRIDGMSRRFGPLVLVVCRPIPLLAEASVLLLGTTDLSWRRFLIPLALSNLGVAAVYAVLGDLAPLPVAIAASVAIPLLLTLISRRIWVN